MVLWDVYESLSIALGFQGQEIENSLMKIFYTGMVVEFILLTGTGKFHREDLTIKYFWIGALCIQSPKFFGKAHPQQRI